jgi:Uma2 family endonuclease
MTAASQTQAMTVEAYLEWEAQQPLKYEYLNGSAYAMTGGTIPHNDIALNLYQALYPHLRAKGCRVNVADVKMQVLNNGPYFHPDLVVSCDERDQRARKLIQHPYLIVEVLSPATEAFDRGEKFRRYRRSASLQEYVLIDSETMSVECYRRSDRRKWELTAYPPDEDATNSSAVEVHFTSIDFRCPLNLIYEDVELLDAAAVPEPDERPSN